MTRRQTLRAGVLEHGAGRQFCDNGTSPEASWYTTLPPPFTENQEVSSLTVKINSMPTFLCQGRRIDEGLVSQASSDYKYIMNYEH